MKLQISGYLIESDSMQFIVKEKRIAKDGENKGKEYWTNNKYMVKFCDVLKYITDQVLRINDDMSVILDKLEQINNEIAKLEKYPVIFIKEESKVKIVSDEEMEELESE